MKRIVASALVYGLAAFGVVEAVNAAETTAKAAPVEQIDVKAELKKLKKAAGAGEISMKEYNIRKQALVAGQQDQQTAEAGK
ncbi:MAG: hypothetical protein SFV21_21495 [Rhodospirillaceae bacterium]|nr:hypothetical protein [Rhodospirillaceae bacterium]